MQRMWLCILCAEKVLGVCRYQDNLPPFSSFSWYNAFIFCESFDCYFFLCHFHISASYRCSEGAVWADIRIIPFPSPFAQLPPSYHRPTTVDSVSWKTSKHQIWPFSHKARGKTLNMSGQSFQQIGQIEMFHKYLENTNFYLVSNKLIQICKFKFTWSDFTLIECKCQNQFYATILKITYFHSLHTNCWSNR